MTPTPQERTELQRLAEQATPGPWALEYDFDEDSLGNDFRFPVAVREAQGEKRRLCVFDDDYGTNAAAYIAAANPTAILALLSLAAQSEELRAENEAMREQNYDYIARRVNWDAIDSSRRTLESRYTALMAALKKVQRDGAWVGSYVFGEEDQTPARFHVMKDDALRLFDALGALLDSEDA